MPTLSKGTSMYTLIIQMNEQPRPFSRHSFDNTARAKRSATKGRQGLIDVYINSDKYKWSWATLRNNQTGKIEEYYHSSQGSNLLSKAEFVAAQNQNQYNLYIIHKTHSQRPVTIPNCTMQEVAQYFAADVAKIHLYRGKTLKYIYDGQFKAA